MKENKLTQDAYCIVKHIIYQTVRTVPAVRLLLMLQPHHMFAEMLTPRAELLRQSQTI